MCYSVDRPMTPQKCHWFLSGGTGGGEGMASTRGGALRVVFFTHETVGNHRKNSDQTSITGSIMAGWWFGTCFIFHILGRIIPYDQYFSER